MNTTHIHLLLNHFPVIGTLIGSGLLIWGIIKKQDNIKTVAALLLATMAIIAIPVFLTGEPAEDSIEKLPGISKQMIELHEEAAEFAIWLMEITGILSMAALFMAWMKKRYANLFFIFAFILSAMCFAAMARTGYYGGQIRHSEIRAGNATGQQNDNVEGKDAAEKEKPVKEQRTEKDDD